MNTKTNDDLNNLPEMTPAIYGALQDETDGISHQLCDHAFDDLTLQIPDDDTKKLLAKCADHGVRFRSISKEIDSMRSDILGLKAKFGVKQGYCGKRLVIDGVNAMLWSEYCQHIFGVSAGQMNRLLNATDEKAVDTMPPDPRESKNYKLGLRDAEEKYDLWKRKQLAAGTIFKADCALPDQLPETKPVSVASPVNRDDPHAYWRQFREEPQTMASELVAMLAEVGMDYQTILQVVEAVKKQAKTQLVAAAAA